MNQDRHTPVLVNELLKEFAILKPKSIIADCTLGFGGHSREFLKKGYQLIAIDRDVDAINFAKSDLKEFKDIKYFQDNFINLKKVLKKASLNSVDGILLDLGVSTYQLEEESRGFGFTGPLDMRMDKSQELTAEYVLNNYPEDELKKIFFDYGEKVFSRAIANKIINLRKITPIKTGEQLMQIIRFSMPPKYRHSRIHHWATPTFRALRIEVNKDMENLKLFLDLFLDCLSKGGLIAIINFHSIEDRIVKHKFKQLSKEKKIQLLTKKPITASEEEIKLNKKALRAKLRIAKKL